ncbi:uncharacterized protein DS421_13g446030 [Arachis hypogaea]|nr:uncharacterized protein DS421_13g446030 [Arachis hypogaea]
MPITVSLTMMCGTNFNHVCDFMMFFWCLVFPLCTCDEFVMFSFHFFFCNSGNKNNMHLSCLACLNVIQLVLLSL